jgi:hypothetical protein
VGFWQQTEPESALLEIMVKNVNPQDVGTLLVAMAAEGMDKLGGTKEALKTLVHRRHCMHCDETEQRG